MKEIICSPFIASDYKDWLHMSIQLFPDSSREQIVADLEMVLKSDRQQTFMAKHGQKAVGFINVSVRHDYVEGATSSPVGYLEAIYVHEGYRKLGVAKQLFALAENWAQQNRCREMGSDTWADHGDARRFHMQLGFREEDILVHYIKDIERQ